MSGLSELSKLFAQRVGDLEKAREIFTAESRSCVSGILRQVQRARAEPWTSGRVRIEFPREIESESKVGYMSSQYATARAALRFKRGTNFVVVAEVPFGIEYDETAAAFVWQVTLTPAAKFQRIDDVVWGQLRNGTLDLPQSQHQANANTVRFVQRPLDADFSPEIAFNDAKAILELLLLSETALADGLGAESSSINELASQG